MKTHWLLLFFLAFNIGSVDAKERFIRVLSLPNGVNMSQYEVTQGQWRAIMGKNPAHFKTCGDDCPVEMVSYEDIQLFIQRLNQKTGKVFRLPTEAEWLSACLANQKQDYYCGSLPIDEVAWHKENAGGRPHPVGRKKPNAWGLYDMSGNVWEWTDSCGDGDCYQHVYRGGSWFVFRKEVADLPREQFSNHFISHNLGFRLVLVTNANPKNSK